jgi:hypothetical protein
MYAIPNGTKLYGTLRERAIQAAKLKAEGMKPGVPDLCLPVSRGPYGALYIEHKSEHGTVKSQQNEWHTALTVYGNRVTVSRSFEESRQAIVEYLSLK